MVWSCDFTMWHPHGKWCDHVTSPCDIQHESGFRHVGIITGYSSEIDSLRAKILRNHERTNQLVESLQVRLSISRLPVVSHKSFFRVLELSKSQAVKAEKCPDLSRQWLFLECDPHLEGCYLSVSLFASVCMSVSLSVCLSIYLPLSLSVRLPVSLSVCLSSCLSVCLSVCPPACLSLCLPVCLSVVYLHEWWPLPEELSEWLFICLFVCCFYCYCCRIDHTQSKIRFRYIKLFSM